MGIQVEAALWQGFQCTGPHANYAVKSHTALIVFWGWNKARIARVHCRAAFQERMRHGRPAIVGQRVEQRINHAMNRPADQVPNDATPGVDESDYGVWRTNFGEALPAGSGTGGLATSADLASTTAVQPIERQLSTATVDRAMADLATKGDTRVRGGNNSVPRATEVDGVARSRQRLLLDSVCDSVMSEIAGDRAEECNRVDELTADRTSKSFIDANEALFAELQCEPLQGSF